MSEVHWVSLTVSSNFQDVLCLLTRVGGSHFVLAVYVFLKFHTDSSEIPCLSFLWLGTHLCKC